MVGRLLLLITGFSSASCLRMLVEQSANSSSPLIVTFPQFHTYRFSNCSLPGDQIFAKVVYDVTECAVRCVEDTRCVSFSYMENSDEAKEEMDRLAESGSKVTDPPGRCLQFSSACHVNYIQELDIIDKDDPYKQKAFDPRITHMRYLGIHYYVKKSDWKQDLHFELKNYLSFPEFHCGPVYDDYQFDEGSDEGSHYVDKGSQTLERCAEICDLTVSCRGFSHQEVIKREPGCLLTFQMCSKGDLRPYPPVNFYIKKYKWEFYIPGYEFYVGISCNRTEQQRQNTKVMRMHREACATGCTYLGPRCRSFLWDNDYCELMDVRCHVFQMIAGRQSLGYIFYIKQPEITPNYKVIPSAAVISRTHPHKSSSWIGYQQDNSGMRACAAWCMESGTNVISSDHNAGGYCKGFFTRHSGGKNCQKIENVVMEPYDQIYDSNSDLYWKEFEHDDEFCLYPFQKDRILGIAAWRIDERIQKPFDLPYDYSDPLVGGKLTVTQLHHCRDECKKRYRCRGVYWTLDVKGEYFDSEWHDKMHSCWLLFAPITPNWLIWEPLAHYSARRAPVVRVAGYGVESWRSCEAAQNQLEWIDNPTFTVMNCRIECDHRDNCVAFTFDPVDPGCVLHRSRCYEIDLQVDCQVHFFYKLDEKVNELEERGYTTYTQLLCRLPWDLRDSRSTERNCEIFCTTRPECQSWAYHKPTYRCLATSHANCSVWLMEAAADWKSYQKLWTKSKEYCTHPGGCASEEADPYWDFVPEILRPELYADEDEVYDSFESTLPPTHAPQPHTTAESDLGPLLRDAVYDEADGLGDGSFAYSPQLWHLVAVGESKIVAMETQSSLFNDICLCFQLYLLSLIYFREKEQNSNEVVYVNRLLRLLFLYNC